MVVQHKIGLYSLIELGCFTLGIRVTVVLLIGLNILVLWKNYNTVSVTSCPIMDQDFLKKCELKPSPPGALLSSILLRVANTSSLVKSSNNNNYWSLVRTSPSFKIF